MPPIEISNHIMFHLFNWLLFFHDVERLLFLYFKFPDILVVELCGVTAHVTKYICRAMPMEYTTTSHHSTLRPSGFHILCFFLSLLSSVWSYEMRDKLRATNGDEYLRSNIVVGSSKPIFQITNWTAKKQKTNFNLAK